MYVARSLLLVIPLLPGCPLSNAPANPPMAQTVKADVLMVCSLAGADLAGASQAVPVQGVSDSPGHHIGLSLQDKTIRELFTLPLKKLADMASAPDLDRSFELAVQYLIDNDMDPDDGKWSLDKLQHISGHCWQADGWRPCTGYHGFLLLRKNELLGTFEPYSPFVLIDADPTAGKNDKRIHMRFYVNVQPR
jgi:hypothetical protein